jgi:hypothetical protein
MGSTTARGYPYPTGSDRVMDGDNAIEALARAVNDKVGGPMVSGEVTFAILANGASGNVAVTFPAGRFAAAPAVFCQAQNGRLSTTPSSVTATGFVFSATNFSGGATSSTALASWLALVPIS